MFYGKTEEGPVSVETPCFRNFHLSNITGVNVKKACRIDGLPRMPVSDISFSDINIQSELGFEVSNCNQLELHDVNVTTQNGPSLTLGKVKNVIVDNVGSHHSIPGLPLMKISDAQDVFIHSCFPPVGTDLFLQVEGGQTQNIVCSNNNLSGTKKATNLGNEVASSAVIINE